MIWPKERTLNGKVVDKACEAVADPNVEDNTNQDIQDIKVLLEQIKVLIEKLYNSLPYPKR
jgi:hypothetical protein